MGIQENGCSNLLSHEKVNPIRNRFQDDRDEQYNPTIYGNIVAWEHRGDDCLLHYYDLSTHRFFFPIFCQSDPAIYQDTIVWTEGLNSVMYRYDLPTEEEHK